MLHLRMIVPSDRTEEVVKTSSAPLSSSSGNRPSRTASPSPAASSDTTARVTPGSTPAPVSGVESAPSRSHQTFDIGASSTVPSATKRASSQPWRSASRSAASPSA